MRDDAVSQVNLVGRIPCSAHLYLGSFWLLPQLCFLSLHFSPGLPASSFKYLDDFVFWQEHSLAHLLLTVSVGCWGVHAVEGSGLWQPAGLPQCSLVPWGLADSTAANESWTGSLSAWISQETFSPQGQGDPRPRLCSLSQGRPPPPGILAGLCASWPHLGLEHWADQRGEMTLFPGKFQVS